MNPFRAHLIIDIQNMVSGQLTKKPSHPNKNWSTDPNSWITHPSFKSTHQSLLDDSPKCLDNSPNYFFLIIRQNITFFLFNRYYIIYVNKRIITQIFFSIRDYSDKILSKLEERVRISLGSINRLIENSNQSILVTG